MRFATFSSDSSPALLLTFIVFLIKNFRASAPASKTFAFLVTLLIFLIYFSFGLYQSPVTHVLKNGLFFALLPFCFMFRLDFVTLRFLNSLIMVLSFQLIGTVALHFLGLNVFHRDDWFSWMFGYYSGGGTVVSLRFYSYKVVLLMSLIFMRMLYFKYSYARNLVGLLFSVVISGSKALALALVLAVRILYRSAPRKQRWSYRISLLIVFCFFSLWFPFIDLFLAVFDPNDISNETRLSVLSVLFLDPYDLIVGNGFGFSLPQNLIRDLDRPYGYEISYVSYMHKMGLSLFVVFWLVSSHINLRGILALSPILIAALGNPTLSHLYNLMFLIMIMAVRR